MPDERVNLLLALADNPLEYFVGCTEVGCCAAIRITGVLHHQPKDKSGPCLSIEFECEVGHRARLNFDSLHSGIWLEMTPLPDRPR